MIRTFSRRDALGLIGAMGTVALPGCAAFGGTPSVALFDGNGYDQMTPIGKANWRVVGGILEADQGPGFLVSKESFSDFRIHAEFYAESNTNSGIFMRSQDRNKIGAANSYEVNIWDTRKDPTYGTGAIVDFAKVSPPYPRAGGRWNTFEITAHGPNITVLFNGDKTANITDTKYASGPIALQSSGGLIRWRKVLVQPL